MKNFVLPAVALGLSIALGNQASAEALGAGHACKSCQERCHSCQHESHSYQQPSHSCQQCGHSCWRSNWPGRHYWEREIPPEPCKFCNAREKCSKFKGWVKALCPKHKRKHMRRHRHCALHRSAPCPTKCAGSGVNATSDAYYNGQIEAPDLVPVPSPAPAESDSPTTFRLFQRPFGGVETSLRKIKRLLVKETPSTRVR